MTTHPVHAQLYKVGGYIIKHPALAREKYSDTV